MSFEYAKFMAQIAEISPKKNSQCDRAAKVIRRIEKDLDEVGPGVTTGVSWEDAENAQGPKQGMGLGYCRISDSFRICTVPWKIVWIDEIGELIADYDFSNAVPWLESKREDKLFTFQFLPRLIANIAGDSCCVDVKLEATLEQFGE